MSEPEETTRDMHDDHPPTRFSPEDALALFTQNLDVTLNRHKSEIFKELDARLRAKENENTATPKAAPKFRYEANEKQFKFNSDRLLELEKVLDYLSYGSSGLSAAIAGIEKSAKALNERNKILRIADKYGWDVVDEYVNDSITDNTDDATKLRQAEFRAKAKRREKSRGRYAPYQSQPPQTDQADLFRRPSYSSRKETSKPKSAQRPSTGRQIYSQYDYYSNQRSDDKCYYCNKEGHWAYQCPRRGRAVHSDVTAAAGSKQ